VPGSTDPVDEGDPDAPARTLNGFGLISTGAATWMVDVWGTYSLEVALLTGPPVDWAVTGVELTADGYERVPITLDAAVGSTLIYRLPMDPVLFFNTGVTVWPAITHVAVLDGEDVLGFAPLPEPWSAPVTDKPILIRPEFLRFEVVTA